ncbi:LacI family DNA-binding transcriptional regulator [Agromyces sp. H3Y2-19a]|uniref:LacI family DNA-binding transcriptional regulator n=1 Tax=Agromyces TaxID=33877 RepID=UPI001E4FBBAC|nr:MULTISPECIES: LacI family DNA-binding transcriptional regulator [Agromyces]MCD5348237.1 LacI family DNA-binding transcriptional regulator [Agromyces sp. S2-1-8]MDF0514158.1 LacI family DNA-binding transcriptional regulator [Agromyces chromiiresistens]
MNPETPKGRAPSIRDVARLAEVSHQTVSRVLNDHPSIRPETRERVLAAMETLQYRPNRAARALVTSRSHTIGVLASTSTEYGPATSIAAIEDAAREHGYYVNTANIADQSAEGIADALEHLMLQAIEGLVVIAPQVRVFEVLAASPVGVPFVSLQSTGRSDHLALSVDQVTGARRATQHLINLGHRQIVHLAGPQDWIEAEARMRGFLDAIGDADLDLRPPILGDWSADFGYFAGRELLRHRDFTAVFAANDQMAIGFMHAVRDMGLDVPGDISVVGFDDIPVAQHVWPPLTTVYQDYRETGRRAVALLLNQVHGERVLEVEQVVPRLVVRGSTAEAPVVRAAGDATGGAPGRRSRV